jgi:hypothetical protein
MDLSMRISASISPIETVLYEKEDIIFENELVRVDWQGKGSIHSDQRYFDPRSKILGVMEFKQSLRNLYTMIKFAPFAYLVPEKYA